MKAKNLLLAIIVTLFFGPLGFAFWGFASCISVSIVSCLSLIIAKYVFNLSEVLYSYGFYIVWGSSALYQYFLYRRYAQHVNHLCDSVLYSTDIDNSSDNEKLANLMDKSIHRYMPYAATSGYFFFSISIFGIIFAIKGIVSLFSSAHWFLAVLSIIAVRLSLYIIYLVSIIVQKPFMVRALTMFYTEAEQNNFQINGRALFYGNSL